MKQKGETAPPTISGQEICFWEGMGCRGEKGGRGGHTGVRAEVVWVGKLIFPRDLEEENRL